MRRLLRSALVATLALGLSTCMGSVVSAFAESDAHACCAGQAPAAPMDSYCCLAASANAVPSADACVAAPVRIEAEPVLARPQDQPRRERLDSPPRQHPPDVAARPLSPRAPPVA
ncbi:MAG: hypothetical protein HY554_08355 [Elusimicrobia bacterium]|nr:hypothetical protein [Elusimicrobiota bacterium]